MLYSVFNPHVFSIPILKWKTAGYNWFIVANESLKFKTCNESSSIFICNKRHV